MHFGVTAMYRHRPTIVRALQIAALTCTLPACETDKPVASTPSVDVTRATIEPLPITIRRLTRDQYHNTVRDVFGQDIILARPLEPDIQVDGLVGLGMTKASVSPWGLEQYEKQAFDVAKQVLDDPAKKARLMVCTPSSISDEDCYGEILRTVGERLWRRPVTDADLHDPAADVTGVAELAVEAATELTQASDRIVEGVRYGLIALLLSPNFLYRVELGEPDPNEPGRLRYTNYEMASRLSYYLWNTAPDAWLLEQATQERLTDIDTLTEVVDTMIESPRAVTGVRAFFTDMFRLDDLNAVSKDPLEFEHFNDQFAPSAREQTLLTIDDLVWGRDADYRELFTSRTTFINRRLAAIYGIPVPDLEGFSEVTYPEDSPRAGLLGHASILSLHSHPRSTSATRRGRFIRETVICGEVPPPAANVNTAIPEPSPDSPTLRDRVKIHLEVETCATCHSIMDPIGLGMENFDSIGGYRESENNARIDASGDLDGIAFSNGRELGQAVAQHPDLGRCLVRTVSRYATGQKEILGGKAADSQREAINKLDEKFEQEGWRVKQLMRDVVLSPIFRYASEPVEAPADASTGAE